MNQMCKDYEAHISVNGNKYNLPVINGTEDELAVDISTLRRQSGVITIDPGYANTGSCQSGITFVDGENAILRYRGIPIEELAEHSSFLEVALLLIKGLLPTRLQLDEFIENLSEHVILDDSLKQLFEGFPTDAHPMAITGTIVGALSAFHPYSVNTTDEKDVQAAVYGLIGKIPTIVAHSYRHSQEQRYMPPLENYDYVSNFLHMMFSTSSLQFELDPIVVQTMDLMFLLHADHEQNCSASTVRIVGSSKANLFSAISAGIHALWGPLHGGANQAVVEMLQDIQSSGDNGQKFLEKVKNKKAGIRLMGFGHRVYRNFDPRASIIKRACFEIIERLNVSNPLLEIAIQLEEIALKDDYFISRKLFPNVDFYSGIILQALGVPVNMFTTLFTIGRLPGWIAHWLEMLSDPEYRIARPRQIYTGATKHSYIPIEKR